MDDLAGLNWTASNSQTAKKPPLPSYSGSAFAALHPTPPISGRSTPITGSTSNPPSKPTTPSNDSFSNLVAFNSASSNKNLSLQERQKQLLQKKIEQDIVQKKQLNAQYNGDDESFWNNLGSGRSTPAPTLPPQGQAGYIAASVGSKSPNGQGPVDEDDFLAAFNSAAPIKPPIPSNNLQHIANGTASPVRVTSPPIFKAHRSAFADEEDDDPFGLNQLRPISKTYEQAEPSQIDDDDVLGMLSKPISEMPMPEAKSIQTEDEPGFSASVDPRDRAMAELVDMGFPADKARRALDTTESRTNVSGAVSWLLQQAHAEARQQVESRRKSPESARDPNGRVSSRGGRNGGSGRSPVEEYERRQDPRRQRREDTTSSMADKDPAQLAAEFGTNFLKTAGSFWKTGTKKVQQAVQDFNSDSDSSQPRWMREPPSEPKPSASRRTDDEDVLAARRRRRSSASKTADLVTDEARMLDSDQGRPPPRKPARSRHENRMDSSADNSRDHSPAIPSRLRDSAPSQPAFLRQQQPPAPSVSRTSLSRQAIEEQASQAYVSSARRRKPVNQLPVSASESDLLDAATQQSLPSRPSTTEPSRRSQPPAPVAIRPAPSPRDIPPVSAIALNASNSQREAGNAHYKRGDYAAANQAYGTAISHLPRTHPIVIIILANHALTSLKIGEPRIAISDADNAMGIIGASKGESEVVDLKNGEPPKSMREFYGKALMRKAEALEQIEKWTEAAAVWREAVEGGHGGAISVQGRIRAEKAANPQVSKPKPPIAKKPASAPRRSAMDDLSGRPAVSNVSSAAAVHRLRAANAAAEKADDEKFALADSVDARLTAWKGGKADNLRALLSSLDKVLWPEAGWKKIGMAELVLPNKVKIQYMKGIAKVHPDKVCD